MRVNKKERERIKEGERERCVCVFAHLYVYVLIWPCTYTHVAVFNLTTLFVYINAYIIFFQSYQWMSFKVWYVLHFSIYSFLQLRIYVAAWKSINAFMRLYWLWRCFETFPLFIYCMLYGCCNLSFLQY